MGMILPAVLVGIGLILALTPTVDAGSAVRGAGFVCVSLGVLLLGLIAIQLRIPRLAYSNGELLVYLRAGAPIRLPIQYLECIMLSSGSGPLPKPASSSVAVRNLSIRVAEKAINYHHRQVKPTLGRWEDGYITIHGTWCEPLTLDVARRLNDRLAEVQRFAAEARVTENAK